MRSFAEEEATYELAAARQETRIMLDALSSIEDAASELAQVSGEYLTDHERGVLSDIEAKAAYLTKLVRVRVEQ